MSAAAFVLTINLFVAAIFSAAFGVVAAYQRSALGARWLSAAYALGMVYVALEFVLPYQADYRPVSFLIFAVFLMAIAASTLGITYHYGVKRPWSLLAVLVAGSLLVNVLILEMPNQSLVRGLLYQSPYTLVQGLGILALLRRRHWRALDLVLLALLVVSSLHFLAKPFLAAAFDAGALPQDYIGSTYAALSQSIGAMLLITVGLIVLLIMVRDMLADMTARSETDTLSELFNRRGFEDHGDKALSLAARTGMPSVMIVADLDHFKRINDAHGHAIGDAVIRRFSQVLRDSADARSVVGRVGGEEFAVFIPGINVMSGRLYAETVRSMFRNLPDTDLGIDEPLTASFGIAPLRPGDTLSDLFRRADIALYEAKSEGRDRVCIAVGDMQRPRPVMRRENGSA